MDSVTYGGGGNLNDFSSLSNSQANQSQFVGQAAAKYSDPFMDERGNYQNQLRTLTSNPGSMTTSPYYQFALNQGLNSLQRKGTVRSGNKLAELMKYGEGVASQGYFNQANLLSTLSGATTGSPAGAGAAYSGGYNRAQDQRQQAASQRAYAGQQPMQAPQAPAAPTSTLPSGGGSYGAGGGYGTGAGYYGGNDMGTVGYGSGTPSGYLGEGYAGYGDSSGYMGNMADAAPDYGSYDYSGYGE